MESIELFIEQLEQEIGDDYKCDLSISRKDNGFEYQFQAYDFMARHSYFGKGGTIQQAVLDLHRNILKNITY